MTFMIWTGVTASAETDTPDVQDTVQAIDAIDAVAGAVRSDAIDVSKADVTVDAGGTSVELSGDAADGVTVEGGGGTDLGIGLPFASAADEGVVVDGAVVYDNNNGSTTTPLVHDNGSVQILTTIADASAPTEYAYSIDVGPGGVLVPTADGGIDVVDADGVAVSHIEPAWAYDAEGTVVATRYEIEGMTLTQVIDHGPGVAYPVVADPKVSLGWAVYVKYSKSEVTSMVSGLRGSLSSKAKYGSVLCLGIPNLYVAGLCGLLTYDMMNSIYGTFDSAASKGQCVEIQLAYITYVPVVWKSYSC